MSGLEELAAEAPAALGLAFLVFLRVGAAMAVLPAFGERSIPMRVRLVLALAFTAVVAPAVAPVMGGELDGAAIGRHLASETVAGLGLGFVLRFMIMALSIAGMIAAQAVSLSQIFGVPSAEPQAAIGFLMTTAGLALAALMGLHLRIAEALILSYQALPPGRLPDGAVLAGWGVAGVARAFGLAFALAAPFLGAGLVYNVALGAISKAMPQLMVALVGAPAITLGGLVLTAVSLPLLLPVWFDALPPCSATRSRWSRERGRRRRRREVLRAVPEEARRRAKARRGPELGRPPYRGGLSRALDRGADGGRLVHDLARRDADGDARPARGHR